jgi:hypothetical protein
VFNLRREGNRYAKEYKVEAVILRVTKVNNWRQYTLDRTEEFFKLYQVEGQKPLEHKNHPTQKEKVNFLLT